MTDSPIIPHPDDQSAMHKIGSFIVLWSVFEAILEVGIMRELGIDARKSAVITCDMGTKARASCLKALIALHDPSHAAGPLISQIQTEGERNTIHHGLIQVRPPPIKFIRRTADGKYKQRTAEFGSQEMRAHIDKIANLINKLQSALSIGDADLNSWIDASKP